MLCQMIVRAGRALTSARACGCGFQNFCPKKGTKQRCIIFFLAKFIKARNASAYMLCQMIVRAGRDVTCARARALLTLAGLGHKHLTLAQAARSIPQLARPGLRATTTSDQSGGDQSRVTK